MHTPVPQNCNRVTKKSSLGLKLIARIYKTRSLPEPEVLLCQHSAKLLSWDICTFAQHCDLYTPLQGRRCPAKAGPSFEMGGKRSWILLFLSELPFEILGTPQNGHIGDNIKGKPSLVFPVDFSEVSFDGLTISKKNSLEVSFSVSFCWKSWPFLICYKFSFGTGSVKQQWVMTKCLVSPMPHTMWEEGVIPTKSVLAVNWPF